MGFIGQVENVIKAFMYEVIVVILVMIFHPIMAGTGGILSLWNTPGHQGTYFMFTALYWLTLFVLLFIFPYIIYTQPDISKLMQGGTTR